MRPLKILCSYSWCVYLGYFQLCRNCVLHKRYVFHIELVACLFGGLFSNKTMLFRLIVPDGRALRVRRITKVDIDDESI